MRSLKLLIFILAGTIFAGVFSIHNLEHANWYMIVVASLLASGLYASTYGIELVEARKHLRIILSAVTIGVLLKAVIIGGSLALIFQDPLFLLLGVAVAQIDPLSVAGLMKGDRMSKKAKTILASWASFDDPITVILSLYTPLLIAQMTGLQLNNESSALVGDYLSGLAFNILLAGGVLAAWLFIRHQAKTAERSKATVLVVAIYVLLAISFTVSIWYFAMLAIALIGLFLRPSKLEKIIDPVITWALRVAAVLLGVLLIGGVDIWKGIALGVAAYSAQVIVGFLLTHGLPKKDRWHIALAQQNGITAIILALLFEPIFPGTVAIVAPAIIAINTLHGVVNKIADMKH